MYRLRHQNRNSQAIHQRHFDNGQELFASVLSIYQGRLINSRVAVERRERAISSVVCFDGEIRQVLANLISNAIDALHTAGGRLLLRSREATNWKTGRRGV
jgi:signal transduction histidine kinase